MWAIAKKETKNKVKNKIKLFRLGNKTYFHHRNGVVVQKNKINSLARKVSSTGIVLGGFFIVFQFGLPSLQRSNNYQNNQPISSDSIINTEDAPIQQVKEPIIEDNELLADALNKKLSGFPSNQKWSVFVYDLKADRTVNINENQEFDAASLYKLFLIESLEKKLSHDRWGYTYVGEKSISDCVYSMLQSWDDPCSEPLAEYIGWNYIDNFNVENGYGGTKFSGVEGRVTTAADVGELYVRLKKGHILSDYTRRFVLDALYQQDYKKGIAKGCKNCRVATKAGELNNISHDAGIVTHGNKSYIVVIMSQGGSFKQITELSKLIDSDFAN